MKPVLYIIFLVLVFAEGASAQKGKVKYYNTCADAKNIFARKGDTIIFKCDSIRLLNNKAYRVLEESYEFLHNTSGDLLTKLDSSEHIYKKMYEQKVKDYETVSASFEDFRSKTTEHILATDTNLHALRRDALEGKVLLQKADNSIVTSLEKIKDFERNKWKVKLKAGFVGFAVAVAVLLPVILFN